MTKLFTVSMLSLVTLLSQAAYAQDKVLLLEATRVTFDSGENSTTQDLTEQKSFKILLNSELRTELANLNEFGASRKLVACSLQADQMIYSQFFSGLRNGGVATWVWGRGNQRVKNQNVSAMNAVATATSTFQSLESLNVSYNTSFIQGYAGVNIELSAKVVDANSAEAHAAQTLSVEDTSGETPEEQEPSQASQLNVTCSLQGQ